MREHDDPRAAPLTAPDWELYEPASGRWSMFSSLVEPADLLRRVNRPVT